MTGWSGVARHAAIVSIVCASLSACGSNPLTSAPSGSGSVQVLWSDEFDGIANAPPDPTKWTYDFGNNGGWGNNELETYTSAIENAHLDGLGHLIIHVDATPAGFTSARLKTQGRFSAQYGHIEARMKLPTGQGIWPAFWMLGTAFDGSNWPQCGEVDIMENIGSLPSRIQSSLHGPGYSGGSALSALYALPNGQGFADGFHTFAMQWEPGSITFAVDDVFHHAFTPAALPAGRQWVFDARFFLLLNVAVGGNYPGPPSPSTQFPQELVVDYVRYVGSANPAGRSNMRLR